MRKHNYAKAILSVLLLCCLFACKKDTSPDGVTNTLKLPSGGQQVIQAHNTFAFNLMKAQLQADATGGNKLISPLSIYLSLAMAYNGAANATKDSIAKALSLTGISINDLNNLCKALIEQLPGEDNKVEVDIANSIWYTTQITAPLPSFLNITSDYYHASVKPLDFSNANAVNIINAWAAANTKDKIQKIIDVINAGEIMYLINAIYFKGSWKTGFKASDTYNDNFYLQSAGTVSVPFMKGKIQVNQGVSSQYTMVELPYSTGKGFSMYILVPNNSQTSVNALIGSLDQQSFSTTLQSLTSTAIDIIMPKWEYSYSIDNLLKPLSSLGMGLAFSDYADFTKLYTIGAKISRVVHKAYVKVDESGPEAAAVTATGVATTVNLPPASPLKLDHPFAYVIAEKQSGTILFVGTLNDPSKH